MTILKTQTILRLGSENCKRSKQRRSEMGESDGGSTTPESSENVTAVPVVTNDPNDTLDRLDKMERFLRELDLATLSGVALSDARAKADAAADGVMRLKFAIKHPQKD